MSICSTKCGLQNGPGLRQHHLLQTGLAGVGENMSRLSAAIFSVVHAVRWASRA